MPCAASPASAKRGATKSRAKREAEREGTSAADHLETAELMAETALQFSSKMKSSSFTDLAS